MPGRKRKSSGKKSPKSPSSTTRRAPRILPRNAGTQGWPRRRRTTPGTAPAYGPGTILREKTWPQPHYTPNAARPQSTHLNCSFMLNAGTYFTLPCDQGDQVSTRRCLRVQLGSANLPVVPLGESLVLSQSNPQMSFFNEFGLRQRSRARWFSRSRPAIPDARQGRWGREQDVARVPERCRSLWPTGHQCARPHWKGPLVQR